MTQGFLERYLQAEPQVFREYVAYPNTDETVQFENGDLIWSQKTIELMPNDFGVKVLIPAETTKHDALRLLEKMISFIEVSGVDPEAVDINDFI
jgi:hypothetical protein